MSQRNVRSPRAFTLVELLVVIGIIAVLIAILLPSLNRSRRAAMQTKCLSNMRQFAIAAMMYASENSGRFVPKQLNLPVGSIDSLPDDSGTLITGAPSISWAYMTVSNGTSIASDYKRGLLGKYMQNIGAYECPELESFDLPPLVPNTQIKISYGRASEPVGATGYTKVSQVRNAASTVIFGDAVLYNNGSLRRTTDLQRPSSGLLGVDGFHGRHLGNAGVLSFFDGHAEAKPVKVRAASSYLFTPPQAFMDILTKAHVGPAVPDGLSDADQISFGTYSTACYRKYDFYFWANKDTRN